MATIEETHPSFSEAAWIGTPGDTLLDKDKVTIQKHTFDKQVLIDTIRSVDEDGLSRQTCDEILQRLGLPLTVFGMKIKKELGLDK